MRSDYYQAHNDEDERVMPALKEACAKPAWKKARSEEAVIDHIVMKTSPEAVIKAEPYIMSTLRSEYGYTKPEFSIKNYIERSRPISSSSHPPHNTSHNEAQPSIALQTSWSISGSVRHLTDSVPMAIDVQENPIPVIMLRHDNKTECVRFRLCSSPQSYISRNLLQSSRLNMQSAIFPCSCNRMIEHNGSWNCMGQVKIMWRNLKAPRGSEQTSTFHIVDLEQFDVLYGDDISTEVNKHFTTREQMNTIDRTDSLIWALIRTPERRLTFLIDPLKHIWGLIIVIFSIFAFYYYGN